MSLPVLKFNAVGDYHWTALTDEEWLDARKLIDGFLATGRPALEGDSTDRTRFILRNERITFLMREHPTQDFFVVYRVGNENK